MALLGAGAWSRAWAFRLDGRELVVRFGDHVEDFLKDRLIGQVAPPHLPVSPVIAVGEAGKDTSPSPTASSATRSYTATSFSATRWWKATGSRHRLGRRHVRRSPLRLRPPRLLVVLASGLGRDPDRRRGWAPSEGRRCLGRGGGRAPSHLPPPHRPQHIAYTAAVGRAGDLERNTDQVASYLQGDAPSKRSGRNLSVPFR